MKLTETTVKKLPIPQKGSYLYRDDSIPGFACAVTSYGGRSFVLAYCIRGKEHRMVIGRYFPGSSGGESVTSARRKALKLRELIDDGIDPMEQREQEQQEREQEERSQRTVTELSQAYLERWAIPRNRPSSVRNDKSMLNGIILPRFGSMHVNAVLQRDVEILMSDLEATKFRANRVRSLLGKMFNLAIEWEWTAKNPVKGVPKYHEKKRQTWLEAEQLESLGKALRAYPKQDGGKYKREREAAASAIALLVETGSRETEVLAARWEEFDLRRAIWTKSYERTKQKTTEHVPLSEAAMKVLKRMQAKKPVSPWLFPGNGTGKARVTIHRAWVAVCHMAGLATEVKVIVYRYRCPVCRKKFSQTTRNPMCKECGPGPAPIRIGQGELSRWKPILRLHDLRHSYASNLASAGVSLVTIGKLLGHRRSETTARYAHISETAARAAAEKFGRREFGTS